MAIVAQSIITNARQRLGDTAKVTFDDSELLGYLNDAIIQLSMEMIAAKDPTMAKELSVTPGTTAVPEDFQGFCGSSPVYQAGGVFQALNATTDPITVRYFAVKARLSSATENIPFGDFASPALTNGLVTSAALRVGYDPSGELSATQDAKSAALATRSGSTRARVRYKED